MERTTYIPLIREMPADMRPRERMAYAGPGALSDAELLAIILATGSLGKSVVQLAVEIIEHFGDLAGVARAPDAELCAVDGVGPAKAAQIRAAVELGKRLARALPGERVQVRGPSDAANHVMLEMGLLEKEELRTLLLDTKNYISRVETIYSGSLNSAVVRVGEVFRPAVRANSASIIVVHNHPSGDPTPSPEDVRVTELMVQAGRMLDIEVLDHIVIGRNRFVSMKERGLGFK